MIFLYSLYVRGMIYRRIVILHNCYTKVLRWHDDPDGTYMQALPLVMSSSEIRPLQHLLLDGYPSLHRTSKAPDYYFHHITTLFWTRIQRWSNTKPKIRINKLKWILSTIYPNDTSFRTEHPMMFSLDSNPYSSNWCLPFHSVINCPSQFLNRSNL